MKLIPYLPEHALQMFTYERDKIVTSSENFSNWACINAETGFSNTVVQGGKILLCAGVKDMWDMENCRIGEAWALFSTEGKNFNISLVRVLKRGLIRILKTQKYWRIQAKAREKDTLSGRLLLTLGFKYEGTLRKFEFDGTDTLMFSIVGE